jgi:hypothetical protein
LGMDVVHLGYGRDHVGASGFAFGGHIRFTLCTVGRG